MSIENWRKEFYPVTVAELDIENMDDIDLVKHALRKWEGALEPNLKKYNLSYKDHCLSNIEYILYFDCDSCSLCKKYLYCKHCPLYITLGKNCDEHGVWSCSSHDATPMVLALRDTLKRLEK